MSEIEYLEIKTLLLEQKAMLQSLFPNKVSISFIKERTGLTRQAIEGGKIFMSRKVALQLLNLIGE